MVAGRRLADGSIVYDVYPEPQQYGTPAAPQTPAPRPTRRKRQRRGGLGKRARRQQ